ALPSTRTLIVSTGAGAGLVSVVPGRDIVLWSQYLVQTADCLFHFLWIGPAKLSGQALSGERTNLADLDPRLLWQPGAPQGHCERKSRSLWLCRKSHGDHCARALIEDVIAQN